MFPDQIWQDREETFLRSDIIFFLSRSRNPFLTWLLRLSHLFPKTARLGASLIGSDFLDSAMPSGENSDSRNAQTCFPQGAGDRTVAGGGPTGFFYNHTHNTCPIRLMSLLGYYRTMEEHHPSTHGGDKSPSPLLYSNSDHRVSFWGENLQPAGVHTSVKCKRWQGGQLTAKEIFTVTERSHTAVVSLSPELMSVEGGRSAERT